jgi:hypothetical protein
LPRFIFARPGAGGRYDYTAMNHPDRLRPLSIACALITVLALAFEIFGSGKSQFSSLVIVMVLLGTALEKIRLELRDIRAEFLKREEEAKHVATETV